MTLPWLYVALIHREVLMVEGCGYRHRESR
jgi:hypothetical protein